MKKEIIEKQLIRWFDIMLQKYAWLNIQYEYSDIERCFLVSFSPGLLTKASEDFSKDALEFENLMNKEYGIEAPLFCDDEELFKMSHNAVLLSNPNISTFTSELSTSTVLFDLNNMIDSRFTTAGEDFEDYCYTNHEYDIAA